MDIKKVGLYKKYHITIVLLLMIITPNVVLGQFVPSAVDPMKKWSSLQTKHQKIVFPTSYRSNANIIGGYIDTISPFITRGLSNRIYKFPILIHTSNILSNGMVTWVPKRMEIATMPMRDAYATQWLKQLTVHEYRHVAQMSTLNVGFTKALSYVIGELSPGLMAAFIPGYFLEGDATYIETMFSTYGRGRQPNFSVEYRAILNESSTLFRNKDIKRINLDKIMLGSDNHFVPDKYRTGYLLVGAANRYYGMDFWKKVIEYVGRYPFTILPTKIAFKKYANSSQTALVKRTFAELKEFWDAPSSVANSSDIIETPLTSYSTYTDPLPYNDSIIIALKKDLDRSSRFVEVNIKTKKERVIKNTGYVTSRPIIKNNIIYWTQYKPSKSWGEKNTSAIYSMPINLKKGKLQNGKVSTHKLKDKNAFYITAIGDKEFAMLHYDQQNNPHIIITDNKFNIKNDYGVKWSDCSFNGLAWDDKTEKLIAIILNYQGMWLGELNRNSGEFEKITMPSYVSINNLTASSGKLYFTSISSGKDEVHCFDLNNKKEQQLTQSKYGSVASSLSSTWSQNPSKKESLLMTTYTIDGYLLSKQDTFDSKEIGYRYTPNNFINLEHDSITKPNLKDYPIINLDTVNYTTESTPEFKTKKYRKGGNLFNIHSWAPLYFNPTKFMEERKLAIGFGAIVASQNLLSTMLGNASVGYYNKMFAGEADLTYKGLPVHIIGSVSYGGGYQNISSTIDEETQINKKKYFSAGGTLSLPLNLSSGPNNRYLTVTGSLFHYNTRLITKDYQKTGVQKLTFGLSYQSTKSTTRKSLAPRLGIYANAYISTNPFMKDFGTIYGVLAQGYMPGFARNHAIVIKANIQHQTDANFHFKQKALFPKGAYEDFSAKHLYSTSFNYEAPIVYPNWGFQGIIYFRRITALAFGDYAYVTAAKHQWIPFNNFYSYGGGVMLDMNLLRISNPIRMGVILYKTNSYKGMGTEFVFSISL